MRILCVTPEWPYPPNQGGRIRMFNLIKQLAQRHQIHLVSVALSSAEVTGEDILSQYCHSIHIVAQPVSALRTGLRILYSLVSRRPFVILKHTPSQLTDVVLSVARKTAPDLALAEFHYIYDSLEGLSGLATRVVDMHNVDYLLYDRFAQSPRWGLKKVHGWFQRRFMYEFERQLPRRADLCITVSEQDRHTLKMISGMDNIAVVPNGVDTEYFDPAFISPYHYDLIFVGSMDYYPNIDAVLFLCGEIMPRVWRHRPQTTLAIVGRDPAPAVVSCGRDPRITVTGTVADVRPYLAGSSVFVAPLRIGGGTRLKILEAMAMARPVVATTVGCEGIQISSGLNILVGDTPSELASAILSLLREPDLIRKIGLAGRLLVETTYDWKIIGQQLEQVLQNIIYQERLCA